MYKTLKVIPSHDDERPADCKEFYMIELDILLDTVELTDVSYVVEALTKATVHIEEILNARKEQQHDE